MKIVQVLSVDQQVQHVVTLAANLKSNLHPVQLSGLEELCSFERAEKIPRQDDRPFRHQVEQER